MPRYSVEVDTAAFQTALPAASEELKLDGVDFIVKVGDKVVVRARELAPKLTGGLAASIRATPSVRTPQGAELEVVAGEGEREAVYMEFGSAHARGQPFMRPALAEAAGSLRSIGIAATLAHSTRSRLFARRARARLAVQKQQQAGTLKLTPAQARLVGKTISQRLRYRGPRQTYRRPRP